MTDILCRWLNDEINISQKVEQATFSRDFASGYLVGEVLNKNGLQDDFDQFSQSKTSDSKLNNFTRIEPVLHLLGIPFDTNVARDIMTEKHGTATRLMYQLYIALQNKKKANLTGVAMETMRPAAPAKLNAVETGIYKERLKHVTPRQTDLNLDEVISRFHDKQIEMEQTAFKDRFLEQERIREQQQENRQKLLERSKYMRDKQSEIVAKIQAATVHIPKPPPETTAKAIQKRRELRKKRAAEETVDAIAKFEDKMKMILPPSTATDSEDIDMKYIMARGEEENMMDQVDIIKPASNDDYIGKIRKRLQEDASARAEREKRRRKVLVDQMKAHENQEEARREEMLVNRLMRQSQQERRIAVQLLQARHEKDIIRKNRITREQQYEQARLKDFDDALNREAELARLAKEEYAEQTRKDQELHDKIAAERAEEKYRKHYDMSNDVVNQIVDFACKVAEYRELTNNLLPPKLMREWTCLFTEGKPLFELAAPVESTEPTPEQILEQERQKLLDETDFMEYKNMVGEWQPPEGGEVSKPPRNNPIVGHIVQRLFDMVHPPTPPPQPPQFPPFPIRACVLGKVFSGKTSVLRKLEQERRVQILCVDDLVNAALEAHKNGETVPENQPEQDAVGETITGGIKIEVRAPTGESSDFFPAVETVDDVQATTPAEGQAPQEPVPEPVTEEVEQKQPAKKPTKKGKPSLTDSSSENDDYSDNESPEYDHYSSDDESPEYYHLTLKAKLGAKAQKYLKKGQPVDDQVIVDILIEAIRNIPEGTGWVLDGFPSNYNQAKVLEKALTGFGALDASKDKIKKKKSDLVPDPRPVPPPPDPASGIDVVIHFDLNDELCLKRAAGRYHAVQSDEQFHQEFKPPPDGSATGVGKQEQVIPVADQAHDQEQIQHRITGFLDAWPKLEKWYNKFGTLKSVDASQEDRSVYLEVDKILEDTLNRLLGKDQPEPSETQDIPPEEEKKEEAPPPPPEPPKEEPEVKSRSPSGSRKGSGKKGSRPGSSRSKSPKDKDKKTRDKSGSPKRGSGKKSDAGSAKKSSRTGSPKGKKGSGKKGKTPEPEPEPEPQEPTGPPPPEPGSEEWEFVDFPIKDTLAEILAKYWEDIEKVYVSNSKHVFHKIRDERENIYRYFYQIRKDFMAYLRRPDNKQVYISQWQKEYNEIPDDMREDEETKAELHQRVDDLREALWSISDERKIQAENERQNIISDGWLDDRLGVLSNFYITQMQGEVDRFQDTVRMLKDYYRGMDGQIPDELNSNYARLPLIELPVERPPPPEIPSSEQGSTPPSRPKSGESSRSQSPKSPKGSRSSSAKKRSQSPKDRKSRTPSAKKRDKSKEKKPEPEQPPADEGEKKRIPLVPRRPVSPDPDAKAAAAGANKKDKKAVKKDDSNAAESPQPPMDPDERLLFDAFQTATSGLGSIVQAEYAAREAEEEAERKREEEKEREKAAAAAATTKKGGKDKGKKGKSRSPSPKKKKEGEATPTPVSEPESEEDIKKKDAKTKMKEEYYFAIQEEESACKTRLELIKIHACAVLQDLKNKADNAYKDMNDWLGARFLKENESVDHMSEVMRNAIEEKKALKQELVIKQEDFLLNDDLKVLKTPSPPTPPPLEEEPTVEMFTVKQLFNLFNQFQSTAPTGVLSKQSFIDTFETMVSVAYGMEQLPDLWMNINPGQIQEFANALSSDGEYVDWRRCLLAISQPIPVASQSDLLATLQKFKEMDQKSTGFVTREQYDRMDLWFGSNSESAGFNRQVNLKAVLFDFFADHTKTPVVMDYISMLMYFSAHSYTQEGFLRALSVSTGHHMPRLGKLGDPRPPSVTESNLDSLDDASPPPQADDIPLEAADAEVSLDALYAVLHHGESAQGDSHRFSVSADPEDATSREKLAGVYHELGEEDTESLQWKILIEHPLIQDIVQACQTFKSVDVKSILTNPSTEMDIHSTKTFD